MNKKTIRDIDVADKKALVRVDLNVPQSSDTGAISADTKIKAIIPTLQFLIDGRARVILCSHLGRPKGKVIESMRLAPVAQRLSEIIGRPVATTGDCIGEEVERAASVLGDGDILLLENLRFHAEEESNDLDFARALANLAEIYINDAFGTAHRTHASTVGVATFLPAIAGFLMEKEIESMDNALNDPARPFATIVGGAKISDKIGVLDNILEKADTLLIGGGMCATFMKALNYEVGKSSVEEDKIELAQRLMKKSQSREVNLLLPVDAVIADRFSAEAKSKTVPVNEVPDDWLIMDIGHKTIEMFENELRRCKTVIWNGPMGVFEFPKFSRGTASMAQTLAGLDAITIIGGGSTAEAIEELGLADKMTHVSTGGGASLKFLEGKTLPGVAVLQNKT